MTPLTDKERLTMLVRRQHGRVSRRQLETLAVPNATVTGWIKRGHLMRVLPKVYAVGHDAPSYQADLWAAVLYAGPGAMLSHATAAHHCGLIKYAPDVVHVSTPRSKLPSVRGVLVVHCRRDLVRATHSGMPVTTVPQTLLDLAASGDLDRLEWALSSLDYHHELDLNAIEQACGSGRRGSTALRQALRTYQPQISRTNSKLEELFLRWCTRWKVSPLPQINVWVQDELVDAYWPQHGLVVALDGGDNHSSPAQLHSDRLRDMKLRAAGIRVVRYGWRLITDAPADVYADLMRQLDQAAA